MRPISRLSDTDGADPFQLQAPSAPRSPLARAPNDSDDEEEDDEDDDDEQGGEEAGGKSARAIYGGKAPSKPSNGHSDSSPALASTPASHGSYGVVKLKLRGATTGDEPGGLPRNGHASSRKPNRMAPEESDSDDEGGASSAVAPAAAEATSAASAPPKPKAARAVHGGKPVTKGLFLEAKQKAFEAKQRADAQAAAASAPPSAAPAAVDADGDSPMSPGASLRRLYRYTPIARCAHVHRWLTLPPSPPFHPRPSPYQFQVLTARDPPNTHRSGAHRGKGDAAVHVVGPFEGREGQRGRRQGRQ